MKTVAIFGSSRIGATTEFYSQTVQAALLLAKDGWTVATGGGPGLMEAANVGAKLGCEGSTCSLGYSIYLPTEECSNTSVQHEFRHDNFFTRLKQFTDNCDAFIALPGGIGTLLEIMTVIQLLQVGHIKNKPLILVGKFWEETMNYLFAKMWQQRLISDDNQFLYWNARSPVEAAERLIKQS
ncbi:MAG: TIGR00730 family Rossman fold protein [Limisphaerales bacterium]